MCKSPMCSYCIGWYFGAGCYSIPAATLNLNSNIHGLVNSLNRDLVELHDFELLVELMRVNARLASQQEHAQRIISQSHEYGVEKVATRLVSWLNELKATKILRPADRLCG